MPKAKSKTGSSYSQKSIFTPLTTLFMKSRGLSLAIFGALILFGLLSYTTLLRREGFPSVAVPVSVGAGQYFVDDTSRVDQEVSVPLAEVVASVEGVTNVTTTSGENVFTFFADLDSSITNEEANVVIAEAITNSSVLPDGAAFQMVEIDAAQLLGEYDVLISLYSKNGATTEELEAKATELSNTLRELELVGLAQVESQFTANPSDENDTFKSTFDRAYDSQDQQFRESATIGVAGDASVDFDLFDLDDELQVALTTFNEQNQGFTAVSTADLTTSVSQDIASLQQNVLYGALVVTVISAILITWRVSILTAFFIVAVLLVSVAMLYLFGLSLNTITLFSLVLALGLFVDDATIISEAIYAKRDKKKKPLQVIQDAIDSVGTASFSGTLTTVLVFSPLLFISGILGDFIFQMPLTVILSLIVSFLLSITLIPLLANYTVLGDKKEAKDKTAFLSEPIARSIKLLKTKPRLGWLMGTSMVGLSVLALVIGAFFFGKLGLDIFPSGKDGNSVAVNINFDAGTTLVEAEVITDTVAEEVADVFGENIVRANSIGESAANKELAPLVIELIPYTDRDITSAELVDQLEERLDGFEGASITASSSAGGPPEVEFPFFAQVFVQGNVEETRRATNDILEFLRGYESVQSDDSIVRVEKFEIGFTEEIVRLDGAQYFEIRAGFDADGTTGVIASFSDAVEAEFTGEKLAEYGLSSSDVTFDLGQESDFADSFAALPFAALGALAVMVVLLTIQFRSLLKPLLILLALPFSFFGVGVGLFVTDNPLSFFVMIGMIGLIGIAVNNTILLVDKATHHRKSGLDRVDSMAQAIRDRFRPLVTTTITTVAALLPLALTNPFWEALSFTIIFGLISSTILVVVSFPFYYIAADWMSSRYGLLRGFAIFATLIALLVASIMTGYPAILLAIGLPVYELVKYIRSKK